MQLQTKSAEQKSASRPLKEPDFSQPFILQTNTTEQELGAVLIQEKEGERRPVVFLSQKLDRETRMKDANNRITGWYFSLQPYVFTLDGGVSRGSSATSPPPAPAPPAPASPALS
uniref:Reverse transcriptase/retrotransposon-derived protein RNase H-like domain-containing protein n=1 Tax=Knipowitschia caucasica TaxID=637954 RepID=A0AAV2KL13_KNICA